MTLWSDLFADRHLLSRTYYGTPGTFTITMPARAAYVRFSLVGAGGSGSSSGIAGFGYGAAFARKKTTTAPAEQFSLKVGDHIHAEGAGDAAGDSTVTRVSGSVPLAKAARGTSTAAGSTGNSLGDVTRAGGAPNSTQSGSSAGDDSDPYPLGFGATGAGFAVGTAAGPGGGGEMDCILYDNGGGFTVTQDFPAGDGLICVEVFDQDPGILISGY